MINKLKHRPRVSAFTILLFVLLSAPQIFAQDAAAPAALSLTSRSLFITP
jgi:hypothetical protein